MKQAIMTEPGKIIFTDIPVPQITENEILVKMNRIGVCGSDIHVWHGKHPYTSYPVVQGHEVSATVVEVGSAVENYKAGDHVTIQPQVVCGKCYPCTHGMYNDCEELKVMGFQTTGMASEYFAVDASKALHIPENISFDEGAMIEPLAVACHAVKRMGDCTGKKVIVLGAGSIGNLVSQVLMAEGAADVLTSELSEYRRSVAAECGLIHLHDPSKSDLRDAIFDTFGSDGADVIFECIGSADMLAETVNIARKGSDIIVVGVVPDLCKMNMGYVQDHELRLVGSAMYRVEDYIRAIELLNQGKISLKPLITHHFNFDNYEDAYKIIEESRDHAMKVMIVMP